MLSETGTWIHALWLQVQQADKANIFFAVEPIGEGFKAHVVEPYEFSVDRHQSNLLTYIQNHRIIMGVWFYKTETGYVAEFYHQQSFNKIDFKALPQINFL